MRRRLGRLVGRGRADSPPVPSDLSESPAVGDPLVRVDGVSKQFPVGDGPLGSVTLSLGGDRDESLVSIERQRVTAVDDVSFDVRRGETLGLVGESGCGKSTLARTVLGLLEPDAGRIYVAGRDLTALGSRDLRDLRSRAQIVFQDPRSSLDPRMTVGRSVEEPMEAHDMLDADGREARARSLLETVGLSPQHYDRYPHAFSGGQRQRIALARALSVDPDFVVCDEPVSALDVSAQAQILQTMADLQDAFGLTYLVIAHDLSVIRHVSDRVAVMYLGNVVELADTEELFENPQHPYTESLLEAVPVPDPRADGRGEVLAGEVPSPIDPPSGCRFHTRCPKLIAPPDDDFDAETWDAVRSFVRAVDRETVSPTDEAAVRADYFGGVDLPPDAATVVDAALADLLAGRWDTAADRLQEAFVEPSVCARERPDYEVESEHGDGRHRADCHRHRD